MLGSAVLKRFVLVPMVLLILLLLPASALADTLNDLAIFNRCYMRMVRAVPDKTSSLYQSVAAGKMSGPNACLALFQTAEWDPKTQIMINRTNPVAKSIVKTFNDLHMSWFESKYYISEGGQGNFTVRDIEEPALYFTQAAFTQGAQFSSVVTMNSALQGVRDRPVGGGTLSNFLAQNAFSYSPNQWNPIPTSIILAYQAGTLDKNGRFNSTLTPWPIADANLVSAGSLVGVKVPTPLIAPSPIAPHRALQGPDENTSFAQIAPTLDLNKNNGGGIIGSQTFLLDNSNLTPGEYPDSFNLIYRRITARVFEDLMCETLPTLTQADVASELLVPPYTPEQQNFTFQQNTSCLSCHSGVDGAAIAMRNLFWFESSADNNQQTTGLLTDSMVAFAPVSGSTLWPVTVPAGTLHYRENLTGNLIQSPISSIADMGNQIAGGNDLYLCAAKRYYQFFTNINVDLTSVATDPFGKSQQQTVQALGQTLKSTQSVEKMLLQLFQSPQFSSRNFSVPSGGN